MRRGGCEMSPLPARRGRSLKVVADAKGRRAEQSLPRPSAFCASEGQGIANSPAKETLGCLTENIPARGPWQPGRKPLVQASLLLQMLPCSRGCRFSDECPESDRFAPVFRCRCFHDVGPSLSASNILKQSLRGQCGARHSRCKFWRDAFQCAAAV